MSTEILTIEDDHLLNGLVSEHLGRLGYHVLQGHTWAEARGHLERSEPKLILMDVRLPDADGLKVLPDLAADHAVIVLTAYGSVRDAVQAMQAGAAEYLVKPLSLDELELTVQRTLETAALREDHQFCKRRLQATIGPRRMVGDSAALQQTYELIAAVAPSEMTVLIQGESGVGKELVARALHEHSPRSARNFVAVDCCTLQEKLFESELFGHERGAFTSADRQKKGLIEAAEGGTLFLDEIGEIEPSIQAKLLRVLETGRFRRVGGTKDLNANIRVVAATNRNLEERSRRGDFRLDLFYRLSAFVIETPPLRERREDIPDLTRFFIEHNDFSRRINKAVTRTAMRQLMAYDWPGNVRELKNVVERAIILARGKKQIGPEHLTFSGTKTRQEPLVNLSFDHEPTLEEIEKAYLGTLLTRHDGRRSSVARAMGISERNVYRLIRKYGYHNGGE
jgi:DNA-binding NtrC family response regulator